MATDLLSARTESRAVKDLPYVPSESARADCPTGGVIARGVNRKSGDAFLIFQDGRTQQAVPLGAVAQAIYSGIITREEIAALHAAADKDAGKDASKQK